MTASGEGGRIPFHLTRTGQIVIQVPIEFEDGDKIQVQAILDTGSAESWINTSAVGANRNGIADEAVEILDASGRRVTNQIGSLRARWLLPRASNTWRKARILDTRFLQAPTQLSGLSILGMDALGSGKVAIDMEQRELIFGDQDLYPVELPFAWSQGTIYVHLDTAFRAGGWGSRTKRRYLVDTGQSSAIQLPESYAAQFEGLVYWESGFFTLTGNAVPCKVFPYGRVKVGGEWVGPFEVSVGGADVEPSVGADFFQHCKVQFDFEHRILRIKRYSASGTSPFKPLGPWRPSSNP